MIESSMSFPSIELELRYHFSQRRLGWQEGLHACVFLVLHFFYTEHVVIAFAI